MVIKFRTRFKGANTQIQLRFFSLTLVLLFVMQTLVSSPGWCVSSLASCSGLSPGARAAST